MIFYHTFIDLIDIVGNTIDMLMERFFSMFFNGAFIEVIKGCYQGAYDSKYKY
ncbi:hypothetical protein ACFL2A_06125 [Thermodesulfobacteriota bacterium]